MRTRRRFGSSTAARAAIGLILLTACDEDAPSLLDPAGPGARRVESLWWLMVWISVVVVAVVLGFMAVSIARARKRGGVEIDRRPVRWGEPFIVAAGVVVPAIVLTGLFLLSLRDMNALSAPSEPAEVTVEVVAKDWWWEVRYPESGVVTANEIHIPVGETVRVRLLTDDVIHSFWVPRLQVKRDAVNGQTNYLWLEADEPGRYRGQCAEFCGIQHANMIFYVIAEPRGAFDEWLGRESEPAEEPVDSVARRGQEVFLTSTCAGCHAVRGSTADSDVGPDLTHLAGRETLAAGVLPNTRADLASWILDPQAIKPGAIMPPTELTGGELEALLDYLEGLE